MDQLQRLGDRLDVIEASLTVAMGEPDPQHRGRMLDALSAATEVARADHDQAETAEQKRSSFRLVHGLIPHPADHAEPTPTADASPSGHSMYRSQARAR